MLAGFDGGSDEGDEFFFVAFRTQSGNLVRAQRLSVDDSDFLRPQPDAATRHCFVGASDADWIDRDFGSTNQRDESGLEFADVAVEAPSSFRKQSDQEAIVHSLRSGANGCRAGRVPVYRHDVSVAKYPADHRHAKQRVSCEIADRALQRNSDQRRVEIALMVDQYESAAGLWDVLKN